MKKAWIVNASLLLPGVRSSPTSANPRAPPRLQWCPPSLLLIKSDFFDAMEMYAKFLDVRNAIFTVFFTMEFAFTPVWATSPDTKSSDEAHPQIHHFYACPQRTDSVLGLATNSTFFVAFF